MNTQMKEYRKATLRLAYLLTLMLWTGSCIDMDINRNPYETTQDELMRENHIIGSSLKSMEALVVPTQEHLYGSDVRRSLRALFWRDSCGLD